MYFNGPTLLWSSLSCDHDGTAPHTSARARPLAAVYPCVLQKVNIYSFIAIKKRIQVPTSFVVVKKHVKRGCTSIFDRMLRSPTFQDYGRGRHFMMYKHLRYHWHWHF